MSVHDPSEFQAGIERVESLVQALEAGADDKTLATARELTQALLSLHGAGLARLLKLLDQAGAAGQMLVRAISEDSLLASLLLLHGLHPLPLGIRVEAAVAQARPQIALLGGTCELVEVRDGNVRVRLSAPGSGPASAAIRRRLEEAMVEHAPDAAGLEIEGLAERPRDEVAAASGLITLRLPSERGLR